MEIITHFFASKSFEMDAIMVKSEILFQKYARVESLVTDSDLKRLKQFRKK